MRFLLSFSGNIFLTSFSHQVFLIVLPFTQAFQVTLYAFSGKFARNVHSVTGKEASRRLKSLKV